MPGWSIAVIVVAAVIVIFALALFFGALFAFRRILGRRKPNTAEGEFPEKYAVDVSWFDAVKDKTDTLEITAYDGTALRALRVSHAGEDGKLPSRVAVLQHGYRATPRAMQPYARILFDMGYDVVLPAARGHDISGGEFVGMAWIDRFDYLRWLAKVVRIYGESVRIVGMGVSMGGSTVIAAAGTNPPPQLKCVIDDCGFSSQRDEYFSILEKTRFPKRLALLPLAIGVRLKCGYSVYDADITELARKMTVPALFIHGTEDKFVPCELGKKLFEACASPEKQLYLAEGAIHAGSYAADKKTYTDKLTEFVEKYAE